MHLDAHIGNFNPKSGSFMPGLEIFTAMIGRQGRLRAIGLLIRDGSRNYKGGLVYATRHVELMISTICSLLVVSSKHTSR